MANSYQNHDFNHQVELCEIRSGSRTIAFGTAGIPGGTPVLYWYPAGGNRRLLVIYHDAAVSASLRLICVNRPGMGATSPASGSGPAEHAATACGDAVAVLDDLGIDRVGLFFMCAGSPFALAFASRYPDRLSGQLLGIAPYVLPADCEESKTLDKFGARHCPTWLSSHVIAAVTASIMGSISSLPRSFIASGMTRPLSPEERAVFDDKMDEKEFTERMSWMSKETGGRTADFSVLMSRGKDLGIDYKELNGTLTVFNGDNDKVTLFGAAEWLTQQGTPSSLKRLPGGSHEGALFLVHPDVKDALTILQ